MLLFFSVELKGGLFVLKIDLGNGVDEVVSDYKKINDGAMHKIKINYTTNVCTIATVSGCNY